jgi:site-specific recombinase XerC
VAEPAGRRRSPATVASFPKGRLPRNKGLHYPADPPTVEEIVAVMLAAGDDPAGVRLRGMIIVLWRAGLRISEAPAPRSDAISIERELSAFPAYDSNRLTS